MKSFAAISLLASAALVQGASLIPTGISQGCSSYLTTLDSDTSFSSFTTPLIAATTQFIANSTSPSSATINAALNALCTASPPSTSLRSTLGQFYSACTAELTSSPNNAVRTLYDTLYVLAPFQQAICSKTDSGDFCVGQIASSIASSALYTTEGSGSQAVLSPNTDTFLSNNIVFLLFNKDTPKDQLCTSCVRLALTSFVSWESNTPYAPGLNQSLILANQPDFYETVVNTCGSSFMQGAVQAAGGLSGSILNGAPHTISTSAGGLSVLLGALTAAMVAAM